MIRIALSAGARESTWVEWSWAGFNAAVEWIVEGPEVWPISVDDPRARRYLLSRFPYSIVYVVAVDGWHHGSCRGAHQAQARLLAAARLSGLGARTSKAVLPVQPGSWTCPAPRVIKPLRLSKSL
jgi:hypothetical protein